ncbi:MAG: polysaccharide deacetylase family protein [Acidobacteriota bacterium]
MLRVLPLLLIVPRLAAAAPAESGAALVVRCGSPSKAEVALTFDDGPTGKHTPRVLAILKQHKVQGTFFVLGGMARRNPALLKRIVDEGHLVASHSYTHPKRASVETWRDELRRTDEAIRAGGVTPSPYFRPPHGTVTAAVRKVCAERRETIVLYTLLSSDWTRPGKEALVRQVVGGLAPGGIVVLHDGGGERGQTVAALPEIIQGLRKKGLEPVRLDTLLGSTPRAESCARPPR